MLESDKVHPVPAPEALPRCMGHHAAAIAAGYVRAYPEGAEERGDQDGGYPHWPSTSRRTEFLLIRELIVGALRKAWGRKCPTKLNTPGGRSGKALEEDALA